MTYSYGGGGWGVVGKPQSGRKRLCQHWKHPSGVHWWHFQFLISNKAAKSMTKLNIQLWGELQPAACLSRGWSHLKTTWALMDIWQASETSHRKSSLGNFQHQYVPEFLVNVYSYCLMVKSLPYCCVCGSRLFSNHQHWMESIALLLCCHWKC